jgi:peptidoglycan hydrolase-like protein with peptidoglycan-binding domain
VSLRSLALLLFLAAPLGAVAAGAFTALHPEEADPYSGFISRVQEKLRELGFDAGPANGDFGAKTQAALGQFQLSRNLPASGQLDDRTLAELGVQREEAQASVGASADSVTEEKPQPESEAKPGT